LLALPRRHFEEIDAVLKMIKNPAPLPTSGVVGEGGCGVVYDAVVMYAHSTGGLVAALYGGPGGGAWRGAVDGYIFNSPFWSWNVNFLEKVVIRNAVNGVALGVAPEYLISKGGAVSKYSTKMYRTYGFPEELKSVRTLAVSAGYVPHLPSLTCCASIFNLFLVSDARVQC
jgi:alpha-beta hydrolase superfamily lysophospholipase